MYEARYGQVESPRQDLTREARQTTAIQNKNRHYSTTINTEPLRLEHKRTILGSARG